MSDDYFTRADHLRWAKARALEELEMNGPSAGTASMISDLMKHPEFRRDAPKMLRVAQTSVDAVLAGPEAVRCWIEAIDGEEPKVVSTVGQPYGAAPPKKGRRR